ncbi:MAG: DUF1573 domain-containing protein [Akkermansiaceae bacterium]|nr:DUF1573 domain-containing protein [Akkermansiaceae bacterium]
MKRILCIWLSLLACSYAAGLSFPEVLKEIHAPADAKTVAAEFTFSNKTDKPITVREYNSTCSCMAVKISENKLRYAPGETGTIRAEFDMGNFSGDVDKVIALWLDGDPAEKPSVSLTVRVHIPVLIQLEPKTLKWDLGGQADSQTIRIQMNHSKPIKITATHCSSKAFAQELKTVEEGKSYDLVVTPLDIKTPGLAIIRIETDCDLDKHRIQQAFAVVRKPTAAEAAAKP